MSKILMAAVVAGAAASASAALPYSTSFENFANGALPGQLGWATTGAGASSLFTVGSTAGLALTGSKYVTINTANFASNTSNWAWIDNPQSAFDLATTPIITAKVNVAILSGGGTRQSMGGLDLYNASGSARLAAIRFRDNGQIDVINNNAQLASTAAGAVSLNAYYELAIQLNYQTGKIKWFVGGTELTGFAAGFDTLTSTDFGDADLYAVRTGLNGTTTGGTTGDTILYDDYSVTATVPTPGSIALLGMAGVFAGRRRR